MAVPVPVSGSLLSQVITYVRRIIKSPSTQQIADNTIVDYINRFYTYDMPERIQLFELKRQYTFETIPNIFIYQFPYKNYQLIETPAYCDGVQMGFFTRNQDFYQIYPELVLNEQAGIGSGNPGPYVVNLAQTPVLRGFTDDLGNLLPYVYITGTDKNGDQVIVVDNGLGVLIQTDATFQFAPDGVGPPDVVGDINYVTGLATFTLTVGEFVAGQPFYSQCSPFSPGNPRIALFFNNTIKLYPVPQRAYKIQFDAFITAAQFLASTDSVPFAYMAEYLARGAARKILSDNVDLEQMQFYEPLFREQEALVLRRTNRINAINRIQTIFSGQTGGQNQWMYTNY